MILYPIANRSDKARAGSQPPHAAAARWQKQRHWHIPQPHCLLYSVQPASVSGTLTFACMLVRPGLAYLWQHQVAGRVLFPGTAMLELALAAISALSGGGLGWQGAATLKVCFELVTVEDPEKRHSNREEHCSTWEALFMLA